MAPPVPASSRPAVAPAAVARDPGEARETLHSVDLELVEDPELVEDVEAPRASAPPPLPPPRQTGKRLKAVVIPAEELRAHLERVSSLPPMPAAPVNDRVSSLPSMPAAPASERPSVRVELGPAPSAMSARASSVPPAPVMPVVEVAPTRRAPLLSATDVFDILFDAMHELRYFETAVEGGSYCLATALSVLPSRAGLVHLYDIDAREFVVVYAQGEGYERHLLSRVAESDVLIAPAMFRHRAVSVRTLGTMRVERHRANASVLVAPVLEGGRFLGAIELVDPAPGTAFDERAMNALTYVADRYAEFLAERGVAIGNLVALAG